MRGAWHRTVQCHHDSRAMSAMRCSVHARLRAPGGSLSCVPQRKVQSRAMEAVTSRPAGAWLAGASEHQAADCPTAHTADKTVWCHEERAQGHSKWVPLADPRSMRTL